MGGYLDCDAPPWDNSHTYRLALVGERFQIQRLEADGGWKEAQVFQPASLEGAPTPTGIRIFISHSSSDRGLAHKLIQLIEAGIECPDRSIRCTSVHGYKLEGGDDGPDVLRANLAECSVVLGVLTKASITSSYVLMELGAAWAFRKKAIPLIGPGAHFGDLPGPFKDIHALKMDDTADMAGLIETLEKHARLRPTSNKPKFQAALDAFNAEVAGPTHP
jgi:hypothetical protein